MQQFTYLIKILIREEVVLLGFMEIIVSIIARKDFMAWIASKSVLATKPLIAII